MKDSLFAIFTYLYFSLVYFDPKFIFLCVI
jgi:hypothetical protein